MLRLSPCPVFDWVVVISISVKAASRARFMITRVTMVTTVVLESVATLLKLAADRTATAKQSVSTPLSGMPKPEGPLESTAMQITVNAMTTVAITMDSVRTLTSKGRCDWPTCSTV